MRESIIAKPAGENLMHFNNETRLGRLVGDILIESGESYSHHISSVSVEFLFQHIHHRWLVTEESHRRSVLARHGFTCKPAQKVGAFNSILDAKIGK